MVESGAVKAYCFDEVVLISPLQTQPEAKRNEVSIIQAIHREVYEKAQIKVNF
jgi:ATP-binding protein involved in chromosome partitioning